MQRDKYTCTANSLLFSSSIKKDTNLFELTWQEQQGLLNTI